MMQTMKKNSPGRKLLRKLIPLLIILAALVIVLVIYMWPVDKAQSEAIPPRPMNVIVEQVRVIPTMPDEFELDAKVEPNRVVKVAAEVQGRIATEQMGIAMVGDVLEVTSYRILD